MLTQHIPSNPQFFCERFYIDAYTDELRWKYRDRAPKSWNTKYADKPAGYMNSNNHIMVRVTYLGVSRTYPADLIRSLLANDYAVG